MCLPPHRVRSWLLHFGLAAMMVSGCASAPPTVASERSARTAELRLVAGGDVMFGRWQRGTWRSHGGEAPFAEISEIVGGADLSLVNLETGLCDHEEGVEPGVRSGPWAELPRLSAPLARAEDLAEAGVDVVVLANNHAGDCGGEGLWETVDALGRAGVTVSGVRPSEPPATRAGLLTLPSEEGGEAQVLLIALTDRPPRPTHGDLSIAWVPTADFAAVATDAVHRGRAAYPEALVVVSLHWGAELVDSPSPSQMSMARQLAEAGADVILGHHSHVVQRLEWIDETLVAYSLGNLVFDMRDPRARLGALLEIELVPRERSGTMDVRVSKRWRVAGMVLHGVEYMGDGEGPRLAQSKEALEALGRVFAQSKEVGFVLTQEEGRLLWIAHDEPSSR